MSTIKTSVKSMGFSYDYTKILIGLFSANYNHTCRFAVYRLLSYCIAILHFTFINYLKILKHFDWDIHIVYIFIIINIYKCMMRS